MHRSKDAMITYFKHDLIYARVGPSDTCYRSWTTSYYECHHCYYVESFREHVLKVDLTWTMLKIIHKKTHTLPSKTKRQYLFILQVSRCCLRSLQSSRRVTFVSNGSISWQCHVSTGTASGGEDESHYYLPTSNETSVGYCRAKSKGSICLLYKWADVAYFIRLCYYYWLFVASSFFRRFKKCNSLTLLINMIGGITK